MRWPLAVACLGAACSQSASGPDAARASLRVPLPEGWVARAAPANGLEVGPEGRVVLHLESNERPFPEPAAFFEALAAEHVEMTQKESMDSFVGAKYLVGADEAEGREAFLGVRRTGRRTVWCATGINARPDEVEAAMTVCRSLSWEG